MKNPKTKILPVFAYTDATMDDYLIAQRTRWDRDTMHTKLMFLNGASVEDDYITHEYHERIVKVQTYSPTGNKRWLITLKLTFERALSVWPTTEGKTYYHGEAKCFFLVEREDCRWEDFLTLRIRESQLLGTDLRFPIGHVNDCQHIADHTFDAASDKLIKLAVDTYFDT